MSPSQGRDLRGQTRPSRRLSAIPSCAGQMARFACTHARSAGIALPSLLRRAGLTTRDIEDASIPLKVSNQIKCLNLIAKSLNDRLLGFHVVQNIDLRRLGFLYYVAASSETLGEALQRIARYSGIVNEGIRLETKFGRTLRISFAYAGVSRHSDRHQIEAWTTGLVRICRELTGRGTPACQRRAHPPAHP